MLEQKSKGFLSSKERVKSAINHEYIDRVPKGEILIEEAFIVKTLQIDKVSFEDKLQIAKTLHLDIISLHPSYPLKNGDLPPISSIQWADLKDWVDQSGLFIFAVLDGFLGWGVRVFGYKDFLVLSKKSPLIFEDFKNRIIALNIKLAEGLIDSGIDGLILADDLAHQKGLLFSPEITKRDFLMSLIPIIEKIYLAGIPMFLHSDGNLTTIMQDIIDIGFQGLHCIDKNSNMDVVQLQRDFGRNLTLWGSLSVEDLIHSQDIYYRQKLNEKIFHLNANSGFILGTDSGLFPGIDFESLKKIYSEN